VAGGDVYLSGFSILVNEYIKINYLFRGKHNFRAGPRGGHSPFTVHLDSPSCFQAFKFISSEVVACC
jgi:hypothetical protein